MNKILYLTDLYFQAKGRKYYEEDLYIIQRLNEHFNVLIGHPQQALAFTEVADLIVFRNTGPVMNYLSYFQEWKSKVIANNIKTYNSFDGSGDMKGKQYLIDLTKADFPVIPTVDKIADINILQKSENYIVKPIDGADSIGMKIVKSRAIESLDDTNMIIQPLIDFKYEISFYFIDGEFQYALYAPDKNQRWSLEEITPSSEDLNFAQRFIDWNDMKCGIQRVDACRLKDGGLLLVELEDLNPFLSIELLSEKSRNEFILNLTKALNNAIY